jgi:Zn finger protein HypA/HybF involved in hydrogenase expression
VGSLERRLEVLEQAGGDGECPRCAGTTVIIVNGKVESVNRDGQRFTPKEAQEFAREEEQNGRCPLCGQKRQEIMVGGGDWRKPS